MFLRMITCSNQLRTGDDVRELANCNALSVLDLSHNLLEEPEVTKCHKFSFVIKILWKKVLEILVSMLELHKFSLVIDYNKNSLEKVLEILASMPELHVLNMSNNHIQRTTGLILLVMVGIRLLSLTMIPFNKGEYRRSMIFNCPKLTYLDSRPIQPRDRAVISAWKEVRIRVRVCPFAALNRN